MQIWMNLVLVLQMVAAIAMIGLVLVQHGKGADMGASFGSGASGSLFGATGSANFLSRFTAGCAAVFFATTLALAFFANAGGGERSSAAEASVLDRAAGASAPASAAASAAAGMTGAIPGTAPAAVAPAAPASVAAPAAAASTAPGTIPAK